MYTANDPRSTLAPAAKSTAAPPPGGYFGSQVALFYGTPPQESGPGHKTWIARGQNFIVAQSEAEAGAVFTRTGQPDEYAIILPERETGITVTTAEGTVEIPGFSIVFVPPGDSQVRVTAKGRLTRLFSPRAEDLAAQSSNAAAFRGEHPTVPPFQPWPEPPGGLRLKWYTLDVPEDPSRFGRIYRCTTMMINFLIPRNGPRARDQVSPHHHDNFEQCSLALDGQFTHHLRWPWTTNMNIWREDEHLTVGAPSICVIPPPAIHTTTAEGEGLNQLVDIFAPPRLDFSMKPGWVVNAEDYPMPGV